MKTASQSRLTPEQVAEAEAQRLGDATLKEILRLFERDPDAYRAALRRTLEVTRSPLSPFTML